MRDIELDSSAFRSQVSLLSQETSEKFLTGAALVSPKRSKYYISEVEGLKVHSRSKKDLLALAIISWWLEDSIRFYLQEELYFLSINNSDLIEVRLCLTSKSGMLNFLEDTTLYHSRDLFGNILPTSYEKQVRLANLVSVRYGPTSLPKRVIRRRGYKDHGSRRFPHEVHDLSSGKLAQIKYEEEIQSYHDTLLFLRGWLDGF